MRGDVVRLDAAGHEIPAGAGVRVFSFAGERAERIAETETDAQGAFELREDLTSPQARTRGARWRGFAAESRHGPACSYPALVGVDGPPATPAEPVRLVLRPGVLVRGRLVDPAGKPVAHGQGLARWLLPAGAHLPPQDQGGGAPRHYVLESDDQGEFALVVPAGELQLRGRRGRLGGLGPPADLEVGADPLPPPVPVVVGAEDAEVRIRVVAPDGSPIPSSFAMLRSADLLYVVASPAFDDRDVGAVFADASGLITLVGVALDAPPFVVGLGAPGYVPRRWEISPARRGSFPDQVALAPKLLVLGALHAPDGTQVRDCEAIGEMEAAGIEETGAARSMQRSDDVLELVEAQVPKTECERDEASGGWRFRVPAPGRYDVTTRIEGLPPAHAVVEFETSGSRFAVTLPPGRRVTLRAAFPGDATLGGYSWHLSVKGSGPEGTAPAPRPFLHVPCWTPTADTPDLVLWCPSAVSRLRVGAASPLDLPVAPVEVLVPPLGAAPLPVPLLGVGAGTLALRYESPAGTPRSGIDLEILPARPSADPAEAAGGYRSVRTDDHGSAALAVPQGEYFVGRSRRDGEPQWVRVRVAAGIPTPVVISR